MVELFEKIFYPIVVTVNQYLSNYLIVIMLVSVGVWYTIKTNFIQIHGFIDGLLKVFSKMSFFEKSPKNSMTSFQALSTAVASQIGTGSIVGVSSAILIGGPGTIFWIWVMAFLGMATIYAEATLAIKTKTVDVYGNIKGGLVYYITTAFQGKFGKILAMFFAVVAVLALGFMGAMVQSNSIAYSLQTAFGIPTWISGIFLIIICAVIFIGGIKRLAAVTEKIIPFMAIFFVLGTLTVLIVRIKYIPQSFYIIFKYALHPHSIISGSIGYAIILAIIQGTKRGLFSNEAGLGSTPHAHALANVKNPHEQGVVAMIGVFIDIFIVLTLNALVIISTLYVSDGPLSNGYVGEITRELNSTNLVQAAFGKILGHNIGLMFVAISLFFFAFSSILSWNLFGKINAGYIFKRNNPKKVELVYYVVALIFIMFGTLISNNFVWELTDMFNNLMIIPNVIALFALTSIVVLISKNKK